MRLEKLHEKGNDCSRRTNIVLVPGVPGNDGNTLADQTCSHFPSWLEDVFASRDQCAATWVFKHDIRIETLGSWFGFVEAGPRLLRALIDMQEANRISEDDGLILIGHKLGTFMLKKAIVEANRTKHRSDVHALLENIETFIMLGEPQLDPENPQDWLALIMNCLPCKTLPDSLKCAKDAKCLEHVASVFEEFTVHSHYIQLSNSAEPKKKSLLKFYRQPERHRCICSANMTVRMWSTTNDENDVPPGEGSRKHCAFYEKSQYYQQLISMSNLRAPLALSDVSAQLSIEPYQDRSGNDTSVSVQGGAPTRQTINHSDPGQTMLIFKKPESPSSWTSQDDSLELENTDITVVMTAVGSEGNHPVEAGHGIDPRVESVNFCSPVESRERTVNLPKEISDRSGIAVGGTSMVGSGDAQACFLGSRPFEGTLQSPPTALSPSQPPRSSRLRRKKIFSTRIPRRDEMFFFREDLMCSLEDLVLPTRQQRSDDVTHLSSGRLVSIYGLPGVGKTAIAVELSYRIQSSFDHVLWLRANDEIHLSLSFHEAAKSLEIVTDRAANHDHENSRIRLLEWLSTTKKSWLLVFDDADQVEILHSFLPEYCLGTILITTRRRIPDNLMASCSRRIREVKIKPFGTEEAISFLKHFGDRTNKDNSVATLAEHKFIAEVCHGQPLALRAAGTISNRQKLLDMMTAVGRYVSGVLSLYSTVMWANLSSRSCALAAVIAFLDPYGLDDATLLSAQRYANFPQPSFPLTDYDYFGAKDELLSHALCRDAGIASFDMHRITQSALRAGLNSVELRWGFHSASLLINGCWPSKRKMRHIALGNWPEFDSLHGHVSELTENFLELDRRMNYSNGAPDLLNDAYLRILLLSTWYNATRGNAKEDQRLIRLAHRLVARRSMRESNLQLRQGNLPSERLPKRLIDCGIDGDQIPRLVEITDEKGPFVAMSHMWYSDVGRTNLTKSNLESLTKGIRPSEMQGHEYAALAVAKSLGIRYIWIDALCIRQDDPEECLETMRKIPDIYSSAAIVVCDSGGERVELDEFSVDTSILLQPLSFYFNWSEPLRVKNYRKRLQTPCWQCCTRTPSADIFALSLVFLEVISGIRYGSTELSRRKLRSSTLRDVDNQVSSSATEHSNTQQPAANLHEKIGTDPTDIDWEKAESQIRRGISCAEAGKLFEALACFMMAKDCISTFSTPTVQTREVYATASMYIACIYTTQKLPELAQGIVLPALGIYRKLHGSGKGLGILHFTIGNIYDALGRYDESLHSYEEAKKIFDALSGTQELELLTWNAVLNLKLAGHQVRAKQFKEAHALLQLNIDHFQARDDTAAQAHLARALFWQSLVHEAEGSRFMAKAMLAAAKDALNAVRVARERDPSHASTLFLAEDFDEEVELWLR